MKLLIGAQEVKCVFFKDDWAFFIKPIFNDLNILGLDIQSNPFPVTVSNGWVIVFNRDTCGVFVCFRHPVRSCDDATYLFVEFDVCTLTGITNCCKASRFWLKLEGELWLGHDVDSMFV